MGETLPTLPTRRPKNRPMAAPLRYWHTSRRRNRALLERITDGLRALPDTYPAHHCRSSEPIRGYSHAHQVMAVHAGHRCGRYTEAVQYLGAATT
ncbi:hypothetical protein ABZ413_33375 [Nocardia rhamnosiphila]|uniref:hypothetical protein n=1 Tax=Nocardia rhamnosiphila TaxID=426716 RepID=UPI0033CC4A2F